jgi:aminoglycoside phosphotransferase (APT) family kinase protein
MSGPDGLDDTQKRALLERIGMSARGSVEKLSGGMSNITLLATEGERELIVRTPPPGAVHIKAGHDVVREAKLLQKLDGVYPLAPRVHVIVEDPGVIGMPFFAMSRVKGRVLRSRVPKDVALPAATMRALSESFVDALVGLHAIDVERAGLIGVGRPDGYVQRQVDGWCERYEKSKVDDVSDMDRLAAWLKANVPRGRALRPTLVHNDFKYDNVVLDESDLTKIVGVLDWELATVGEAMTDLGTVLSYWIEATDDEALRALPLCLTYLPGNLTRTEVVARYQERTGRVVEDLIFHVVLGSFRLGVIAQQIYFRYAKGFTQDPKYAVMGLAVAVVGAKACRVLDAGRIDVA